MTPVLEVRNITKRFPGVLANDHISFSLARGEILAFLGENGAGKTTLMNILYGLYTQDEGQIFLNGQEVRIHTPGDAIAHGIGMVHQHFMLIPVMTVAENIALGNETQKLFGVNLTIAMRRFRHFLQKLNPLPHLQRTAPQLYQISLSAVGWALVCLLLFSIESLFILLNQTRAAIFTFAFLFSLVWIPMLIDCLRRPASYFQELGKGSKTAWLAIVLVGNVPGALVYSFLIARQRLLPRKWQTTLANLGAVLIVTLVLGGGLPAIGLAIPLARFARFVFQLLAYASLLYLGLWVVLGVYLIVLEILAWLTELVPLGLRTDAERVRRISHLYGLDVDPMAYIKNLPVGVQQRVEIVKALYREADILILDEPTAVLTPQEADELFRIMRGLAQQGKSIIFITHKLEEVFAVADRIIVLRDGHVVGETTPFQATKASLAAMMVGREVILTVEKEPAKPKEVVLKVENLHALDDRHVPVVRGVTFEVRAGEILGIAGVQGNGQTELVEVLTGLRPATGGHVWITGVETTHATPRRIIELGTAHIPEDRQADGLVLTYPVCDNLVLCSYYEPPFARGILIDDQAVCKQADELVRLFDIRTPSIFLPARNLSGGNQQKLIVARELSRPIRLLIAAQPTRGLDVGSIEYIHKRLIEKRDQGTAVLLVSAELDEIMSLSDRIAVMYEGKIVYTVDAAQATLEELGLWMAGAKRQEAVAEAVVASR
ncbi:MAG: ABC transporter ATP-binding protein [Anaerolineae bacterium]|jgi:simple sugar transport system ATP-binding protein|nr:ABC transporter ATP-binding protein [Anaerolineae bacterium]MDH7472520.1 ABC transporter ATP-binding protein [Anaerolineae bacterium]